MIASLQSYFGKVVSITTYIESQSRVYLGCQEFLNCYALIKVNKTNKTRFRRCLSRVGLPDTVAPRALILSGS